MAVITAKAACRRYLDCTRDFSDLVIIFCVFISYSFSVLSLLDKIKKYKLIFYGCISSHLYYKVLYDIFVKIELLSYS